MIKKISVLLFAALLVISMTITTTVYAAASDIIGPNVIHKEKNQVFTIMDLLSLYASDVFIDEDGYTGYGNVEGSYTVTITQGYKTKDVTIIVVDDWDNLTESNDVLFVADYKDIYVSNDRNLTLYEMIYYIYAKTSYVNTEYQFRYEELVDDYHYSFTDGIIPEGTYEFTFRLTYYSGEQATYSAKIHAVELPELPGTVLEPPPSQLDRIMSAVPIIGFIALGIYFLTRKKKKRGY